MKFADSVKQTASLTSTSTITLGAAATGFRTLAQAIADTAGKPEQIAVGDTICMRVDDVADASKWETDLYTITGTGALTRQSIVSSSNAGAAVTFGGSVTVLCTVPSSHLAGLLSAADGLTISDLPTATSILDTYVMEVRDPAAGTEFKATIAALIARFGGTATTTPADTIAPTMNGTLASSNVTQVAATLTWSAASDAVGVTGYEVSKDGGTTYTNVGNVLTYAYSGLTASTTYAMRVRAYDAAGNRATALSLSVTTAAAQAGNTAPSMSGSLTTSNVTATGYTMNWTAGTDDAGVVGYDTSTDGGTSWSDAGNVTSRTITGATASTLYNLRVRARDAAGLTSNVLSATVTTSAAAATTYTVTANAYSDPKDSVSASLAYGPYGGNWMLQPATMGVGYWAISPAPASAVAGWGTSSTVEPATITADQSGAGTNGMAPMTQDSTTPTNFNTATNLWVPSTGSHTGTSGPWFFWIKPAGGVAKCLSRPAGSTITEA